MSLLTRDKFRESVFKRDNYKCVICGEPARDAHHIIKRRLFDNDSIGGYFLSNGASLCEKHHIEAEQTTLSCDDIRTAAGIKEIILPEHFYNDNDYTYDKWGNIIMPNGQRVRGELFYDESVQKILNQGKVLDLFSKYVKYPRTMHLSWSEKMTKDDHILKSVEHFVGKEVVVSLKMDGENTTMYTDHIHARSLDSGTHPSRKWVKGLWGRISYNIPEGWRVCGENLFAVHIIPYENLDSFFLAFSIWNEKNICLSWDETLEYAELLGLNTVEVLYKGIFDEKLIKEICEEHRIKTQNAGNKMEGYVIRVANEFTYGEFRKSVAKFVGKDFVIKHGHWTQQQIFANSLKNK